MSEDQTNPAPEDNDSLQAWMDRAKRAHELVEAVDLDKVVKHDTEEVDKLNSVTGALADLSDGKEITHVEGVDEVVESLDPAAERKVQLLSQMAAVGWSDRLGRVLFIEGGNTSLKPVELIPHRKGLPEYDICIAPEQAVGNGNFALFISANGVFSASVSEPTSKHHWRISRSQPYESVQQLLKTIIQFGQVGEDNR